MKLNFNRDTIRHYSWLPRGITSSILNIKNYERCTLLLTICSDGKFISLVTSDNMTSNKYFKFLIILRYSLNTRNNELPN